MITISVVYTCGLCDVTDATVQLPARDSEQDLLEWMNQLTAAIQADHLRRSPGCFARKIRHVKIPIANAEWVGGPPVQ